MATVVIGTVGNVIDYVNTSVNKIASVKTLLIMCPELLALNPVSPKYSAINIKSHRDVFEPMSSNGVGINGVSQFFA